MRPAKSARTKPGSAMEASTPARQVLQERRGLEAPQALVLGGDRGAQLGQARDDRWQSARVRVAQHAAAEGREAGAEDRGEVELARALHDPLLETARRLVDHG